MYPKGREYMQPGHPQGTHIIEVDAQRELSKLTEPKVCQAGADAQSMV